MTELIFYCLMFAAFLNFSFGCMTYSSINRTFSLMYRGLFESGIMTIDPDGEPNPYFDEKSLEKNIKFYLEDNMPNYVTHYTVSFYYFDEESGLVCTNHRCDAIKISLYAEINYLFRFDKAVNYYISEGALHE